MMERCTITITVRDQSDHYREEDWVKDLWPYMLPWFTRRRGVESGKIILENGAVEVGWQYETDDSESANEAMHEAAELHSALGAIADEVMVAPSTKGEG